MKFCKLVSLVFAIGLVVLLCCGCSDSDDISGTEKRTYSDSIYIALTYGGGGDRYPECYSSDITVYTDGTVVMYFKGEYSGTTQIRDMDELKASLNRDKLYSHKVHLIDGYDGGSSYIYLYDEDGTEHSYGGYMVDDSLFKAYQDRVYDAIGRQWIKEVRNSALEAFKKEEMNMIEYRVK